MTQLNLPALWFDDFTEEIATGIFLANQYPENADTDVDADADVVLEILSTDAAAVDDTATQVYIDGVLAFDGSGAGFQPGYNGPNSIVETIALASTAIADGDMEAGDSGELIADGDMEAAGVGSWPVFQSVVTKQAGSPGGSGSQVLRVAYDGINVAGAATQVSIHDKHTHRLTGWARGDGTAIPEIADGPGIQWTGTSSAVWQAIDITFTAGTGTLYLLCQNLALGLHVEFDDISVVDLTPDWEAANDALVTKSTASPHGGAQAIRLAYNGTADPQALQDILAISTLYRITGVARGDGTAVPRIKNPTGVAQWTGTSSTAWQDIDVTFTSSGAVTQLFFEAQTAIAGWVEFDDMAIEQVIGDVRVTIDPTSDFSSEAVVTVRVVSETVGGVYTLDESYSFTIEDLVAPMLLSALATYATTIRVTFNEGMLASSASGAADALNPDNYVITYVPASNREAAVYVVVEDVTQISATTYDLTTDIELTFWRAYLLTCGGIADDSSNANLLDADHRTAGFDSWTPPDWPSSRRFKIWDMLAQANRDDDVTGDLERLVDCWQDCLWLLIWDADRIGELWDVDSAPEICLDARMQDLGNPHRFSMTELQKRKLLDVLVPSYHQHGTEPAIINLVRFFLGVTVTVYAYNSTEYRWILGEDTLGQGTILGPGDGEPALYTFVIQSLTELTTDERRLIGLIADTTKPAHEHFEIKDPTDVLTWDHWELGYSRLGTETILH